MYPASQSQIGFINSLLGTSNLPEKKFEEIHNELDLEEMSRHRAKEIISFLQENQVSGSPQYSDPVKMKDIGKAVEERIGEKVGSDVSSDDVKAFIEDVKGYGRELVKDLLEAAFGTKLWSEVKEMSWLKLEPGLDNLKKRKIEFDHQIKDKTDSKESQDMAYHCIQLIFEE